MKRKVLVLMLSCLLLTSCGLQSQIESESSTVTETETVAAATGTESKTETEAETEAKGNLSLSNDQYNYLSEKIALPSYDEVGGAALAQIGVATVANVSFVDVQFTDDGDITETILVTDSNGKAVSMTCLYLALVDTWTVVSISDPDTGHYYLVPEGSEKYYDVYSYETGELISGKKEDISVDKITQDYESRSQEISDDFDDALDDIAEKYGID